MLDIEGQLQRYGEAIQRHLDDGTPLPAPVPSPAKRSSRALLAVAVASAVAVLGAALILDRIDPDPAVVSTVPDTAGAGVFATRTGTVLVFSNGIDGATAVDLDRRIAGQRVIEGERAGDQAFRLTHTGDHLVVGWGDIYAAPLEAGEPRKIARGVTYIPAAEEGEVWVITLGGEPTPAGGASLRRVRVDGSVIYARDGFDLSQSKPVLGVPGGLLVETPQGVAVWEARTDTTGRILGPGPVSVAASSGTSVAWCGTTCADADVHVSALDEKGPPTSPHVTAVPSQLAFSADGSQLAVLRPAGGRAELVLRRGAGPGEVVARDLDPRGAVQWTDAGGGQLFYMDPSLGAASIRVGRYDRPRGRWEIQTLGVGGYLAGIPMSPREAGSFFSDEVRPPEECRRVSAGSARAEGSCTFEFSTIDFPEECVTGGDRATVVPDAVGLGLEAGIIRMQRGGLNVVGTGVVRGDPVGPGALIRAQEPPAGGKVPAGACVAFRTRQTTAESSTTHLDAQYEACVKAAGFDPGGVQVAFREGESSPAWVKTGRDVPASIHGPCLDQVGGDGQNRSSHGHPSP